MSHPYEDWSYSVGDPVQDFGFDDCEVKWREISKYARPYEVAEKCTEREFWDDPSGWIWPQKVYLYRADRTLAGIYEVDMEMHPHFQATECEQEPA